jgi:hypothetical protein
MKETDLQTSPELQVTEREKELYAALLVLVELGKQGGENIPSPFVRDRGFGAFWDKWDVILSAWNNENILNLARGLTLFERLSPAHCFGSVSPVPQIYSVYASRVSLAERDALADWILANTVNEYCPFGTFNRGAKSLKEYELKLQQSKDRKLATQQRETARERDAKAKRSEEASRHLPRAIERNDVLAVAGLIAKGANPDHLLPDGRTARQIAHELGRGDLLTTPCDEIDS